VWYKKENEKFEEVKRENYEIIAVYEHLGATIIVR
jgi:hypothetical protein